MEYMTDRNHLTALELILMLALMRLREHAYGVSIAREIEGSSGRRVALASVYATLDRLELRGLVSQSWANRRWNGEGGQKILSDHDQRAKRGSSSASRIEKAVEPPSATAGRNGMRSSQTPRGATWLLENFARSVKLDGDRLTLRGVWRVGGATSGSSEIVWERPKPMTSDLKK